MFRSASVRTQIVAWNTITLAVFLLASGLIVRTIARANVYRSLESELGGRLRPILDHGQGPPRGPGDGPPDDAGRPGPPDQQDRADWIGGPNGGGGARPPAGARPPRRGDLYGPRLFSLDGHCLDGSLSCTPWDVVAFKNLPEGSIRFTNLEEDGESFRVATAFFPSRGAHDGIVQALYPMDDANRALGGIDVALLTLAPIGLMLAGLGGWLLSGRMLARVKALAVAAGGIGSSNFDQRVPVQGEDEFAELGSTMNAMLSRLETAYRNQENVIENQRRFLADASHELKTPLTTIKGNAQLSLSQTDPSGYRQSLEEINRAARDMDQLVQDLLLLARSDSGKMGGNQIELLVEDVLGRAVDRSAAPQVASVAMEIEDGLTVEGNETEMVRLFSNLLENARRYAPADKPVVVKGRATARGVEITILDLGPGIAAEHLPHLGERFYRIDSARARTDGGSGLGLSICFGIVAAHHGTLEFRSEVGKGTLVTVVFSKPPD